MLETAIAKLRNEIDQSKNDPYIQVVGEFLLRHLEFNSDSAEKIMNTEKTIAKSLDAMKKEAEKKKVGNCAVLTDQEGFVVVLKYFEIEAPVSDGTIETKIGKAPVPTEQKSEDDFNVKLEDFLS